VKKKTKKEIKTVERELKYLYQQKYSLERRIMGLELYIFDPNPVSDY